MKTIIKKTVLATIIFFSIAACSSDDCIDESKINDETICTMEYIPVCGCNGKTYANKCNGENAGLVSWNEGACE